MSFVEWLMNEFIVAETEELRVNIYTLLNEFLSVFVLTYIALYRGDSPYVDPSSVMCSRRRYEAAYPEQHESLVFPAIQLYQLQNVQASLVLPPP